MDVIPFGDFVRNVADPERVTVYALLSNECSYTCNPYEVALVRKLPHGAVDC